MDFFGDRVATGDQLVLDSKDQNHNQERSSRRNDLLSSDHRTRNTNGSLKKNSQSGDQIECVAMDFISRHEEQHQEHQLSTQDPNDTELRDDSKNSQTVNSSLNVMRDDCRHEHEDPVRGNSSSSSPTSRLQAKSNTQSATVNAYYRLLRVPDDGDKRLASSYPSFSLGRILSLAGSLFLLIGLLFRFIFMDENGPGKSIPFTIIGASIMMIGVGAVLVIWSALQSQKARDLYSRGLLPDSCQREARPQSGLSSSS